MRDSIVSTSEMPTLPTMFLIMLNKLAAFPIFSLEIKLRLTTVSGIDTNPNLTGSYGAIKRPWISLYCLAGDLLARLCLACPVGGVGGVLLLRAPGRLLLGVVEGATCVKPLGSEAPSLAAEPIRNGSDRTRHVELEDQEYRFPMPRRLDFKLIFSLTILIVAISCISGYLNFRMQKERLVETMILGADQLSRSITSATWHAMLDDDRKAAYEMMRVIADKHGVDRIRMFNRDGRLVFSTDAEEQPGPSSPTSDVCMSCHGVTPVLARPAIRFTRALCHLAGWRQNPQHRHSHS